jgi:hypothetical protein
VRDDVPIGLLWMSPRKASLRSRGSYGRANLLRSHSQANEWTCTTTPRTSGKLSRFKPHGLPYVPALSAGVFHPIGLFLFISQQSAERVMKECSPYLRSPYPSSEP